jgi:CDP-diacylglycerol--serine O-phosphatidyltransferase
MRADMIPLRTIVPNLVTSMAACAGIMSITFSSEGRFVPALFALLVACVCDGMDGRVARMLNASSKLGAELDSLADFVNFGVAPALFMFFWLTGGPTHEGFSTETVRFVLGCALFYAMCDCFRLARFNTMLEQPTLPYWKHFFTGVPAPGGCWMVLTPVLLSVALDAKGKFPEFQDAMQSPLFGSATLVFVGALMASRLPTISLKAVRFTSRRQMRIFTAIALLLIALLVSNIWLTLGIIGLLYIMTVPVTCWLFLRGKRRYLASHPPSAREAADA